MRSFLTDHLTRRHALSLAGSGFALLPLASLLAQENQQHSAHRTVSRVVFLFMNGGPSQVDTFDPKPALAKYDGKEYSGAKKVASGTRVAGTLWKSDFRFEKHGESGLEMSELYPHLSQHADDLCVIRSMHTTDALHAPAMLRMNTGKSRLGSGSLGAWIDYGLGALNENLPHYVVMLDHRGGPISGHGNWATGPLPGAPPSLVNSPNHPFPNLQRSSKFGDWDDARMQQLLRDLNGDHRARSFDPTADQRMQTYELAWKMQQQAPDAGNISKETAETQRRYGLDVANTKEFGGRCLLARRLLERGVRFVQIYSGGGQQKDTWDAHVGNVARHRQFAGETDQPITALLQDLKQSGLWNETLVIWGGEFGRTPTREKGSEGRDHNPHGFSMWLAGGAVRGGHVVGSTDEIGLEAVENPCSVADLHATILHLLGLDHESLRFYDDGLQVGLTGPEPCRVISEVLA